MVELHDRLHTAQDEAIGEAVTEKYGTWRGDVATGVDAKDVNIIFTSPSVHYQGVNRREDD
jgi:hypothetical protein